MHGHGDEGFPPHTLADMLVRRREEAGVFCAVPSRPCFSRNYLEYAFQAIDSPVIYSLGVIQALLSAVCPDQLCMVPFAEQTLQANTYTMLVGATGDRKTWAITLGQKMLEVAFPERIGSTPGSCEQFVDGIIENPHRLFIWGEMSPVFAATNSNGYMAALKEALTSLHDCGTIQRDTREKRKANSGAESKKQLNPRVSVLGGASIGVLERYTGEHDWATGFFPRFGFYYGKNDMRFSPISKKSLSDQSYDVCCMLKALADRKTVGTCSGWTPEAEARYNDWYYGTYIPRTRSAPPRVRGLTMRLAAGVAKSALLYAFDLGVTHPTASWLMPEEAVIPAIYLSELQYLSAMTFAPELAMTADARDLRTVFQAALANSAVTGWVSHKILAATTGLMSRKLKECLLTLQEQGAIGRGENDGQVVYRLMGIPAVEPSSSSASAPEGNEGRNGHAEDGVFSTSASPAPLMHHPK